MGIHVLGAFETDEGPLSPRERAVLSVLTLRHGHPVAPDAIADALWGDDPPSTWTKQVQAAMARIRTRLGRSAITTTSIGYRLGIDPDSIDVVRFERLARAASEHRVRGEAERAVDLGEQALALWRGAPYAAVGGWGPAIIEAARLEEIRSVAEEEVAAAHLDCGEHHSVVAHAEALVRAQPLRERRWSLFAIALYRSGRQADALAALRVARVRLAEELGIEPSHELVLLEQAILQQDASLSPPARVARPSEDCPYKGLRPYRVEDAGDFFGRDDDIAAILARVDRSRFIAVSGPSGCGKSSVVLAGVVPALERRGLAVTVVTPSGTMSTQLHDALYSPRRADAIVIDQLEELFHSGFGTEEVAAACRLIADAASDRIVVVTIRSDFLDECGAEPSLAPLLSEGLHLVGAMSEAALRRAIEEPARRAGLRLETGLTELILRDAGGDSTALPLLSHALVETWLRRETAVLTVAGYEDVGGLTGAIAQTAERLFAELTPAQQDACRSTMRRLVEMAPDGRPVRRHVKSASLMDDPVRGAVITRLTRARLVSASGDTVAVTHELLAVAWPRLHDWLEEDAAGARLLGRLTVDADGWVAEAEPEDDLYRGARLQLALDWRSESDPDLTTREQRFLDAAQDMARREESAARAQLQRDRRQNRRLRVLLGATAGLLVLSCLATIIVVGATQEADRQREAAVIEATVASASALRRSERDVATLIAAESFRRWPDDARSRSALLGVFTGADGFLGNRYVPGTDAISGAVIPDSGLVVIVRDDETAAVIEPESGRVVRELDLGEGPNGVGLPPLVRVSSDGRIAAILRPIDSPAGPYGLPGTGPGGTSQLLVVDLQSGRPRLGPIALDLGVGDLALSPDGRTAAVADARLLPRVVLVDAESGAILQVPDTASAAESFAPSASIAFAPDGRLIVGTGAARLSIVDPSTAEIIGEISVPEGAAHAALAVTSDGRVIASGDRSLVAIDLASRSVLWTRRFTTAQPTPCAWLAVSEQRSGVFCGNLWGSIEELSLDTGTPTGRRLDPQLGAVGRLTVSADGNELVAIGAGSPVISRWRLDGSGAITRMIALGSVAADGYDPSGSSILIASRSPSATEWHDLTTFTVWDPEADVAKLRVPGTGQNAGWAGHDALFGLFDAIDRVGYLDASTGRLLDGDPVNPSSLKWLLASGRRLVVSSVDGSVTSIDPGTRRRLEPILHFDGLATAISGNPDASILAITTARDGVSTTRLVDAATGTAISGELVGPDLTVLAGTDMLVGADDNRLMRYHLPDMEPMDSLPGVQGGLMSLQVSDDGSTLVAGANDETVALYDLEAGIRLGDPIRTESPLVTPAYLRPDGRELIVNMREGIAVWDLDPEAQLAAACRLAGRDFTRQEWATYFGSIGPYRSTCGFTP